MITHKEKNAQEGDKESNCFHVVPVYRCLYLKTEGKEILFIWQIKFQNLQSPFFNPYLKSVFLHQAIKTQQLRSKEPLLGNTSCKAFCGDVPNPTSLQGRHTSSFPCLPQEGKGRNSTA